MQDDVKKAFQAAMVGDREIDVAITTSIVASNPVENVKVTFQSGNDFINLEKLREEIEKLGQLRGFEYHGTRGGYSDQPAHLQITLRVGDKIYVISYAVS